MRGLTAIGIAAAIVFGALLAKPAATAEAWGSLVIANYSCYYGKVTATLNWSGNSPYAHGQYVEMSYVDDGWKPATTTSVGPYHPSVNTMAWDGLAASTRHFLRFRQQYADGTWDTSLTFRFDTPSCGADGFTPTVLSFIPEGWAFAGGGSTPASTSGSSSSGPFDKPGDYDCLGGSGDGPNYIQGPITITGDDPHDLDRDNDGIGCEPGELG